MTLNPTIAAVTKRIIERSADSRAAYLERMAAAVEQGPARGHLTCGNQAHAFAAMAEDKDTLIAGQAPNLGIVTAYNDMLSAHRPYEDYPAQIREAARTVGATAQVAGGVPAMCDGV
ncbi:MAG: dihydroxy-acid dehydratase, partial [Rhodobacteraceae bacterium]|nr:dihydroxy-acid dehydratase [Paracoccaceae bacterium]